MKFEVEILFKDLMLAAESAVLWWLLSQGSPGLLSVDLQGQSVDLAINKYNFYPKNPVDLLCLKIFLFSSNCHKHFCRIVKKQPEVCLKFTYEQVPLGVHICSWASLCLFLLVMCHYDSTDSGNHFLIEFYCQVNKPYFSWCFSSSVSHPVSHFECRLINGALWNTNCIS